MITLRLRAADKESLLSALSGAGATEPDPVNPEVQLLRCDEGCQVVVLGTLSKPTGAIINDPAVGDYEEREALPGYHANVLTDDPAIISALAGIRVYPLTPLVEFSGVNG